MKQGATQGQRRRCASVGRRYDNRRHDNGSQSQSLSNGPRNRERFPQIQHTQNANNTITASNNAMQYAGSCHHKMKTGLHTLPGTCVYTTFVVENF